MAKWGALNFLISVLFFFKGEGRGERALAVKDSFNIYKKKKRMMFH